MLQNASHCIAFVLLLGTAAAAAVDAAVVALHGLVQGRGLDPALEVIRCAMVAPFGPSSVGFTLCCY